MSSQVMAVQTVCLCVIALGLFRATSRLDVGWKRGICALVIIIMNSIMPLWYNADDILIKTIAIFQFTWLSNYKVHIIFTCIAVISCILYCSMIIYIYYNK